MLFCLNSAHFSEIQLVCDGRTDGPTDRRTDTPSYRDARTHLKIRKSPSPAAKLPIRSMVAKPPFVERHLLPKLPAAGKRFADEQPVLSEFCCRYSFCCQRLIGCRSLSCCLYLIRFLRWIVGRCLWSVLEPWESAIGGYACMRKGKIVSAKERQAGAGMQNFF